MAIAIIVMGVSGCGKSSVGQALSEKSGWPFYDGDDFHPQANITKMAAGVPLNDEDRQPWLETLHELIMNHLNEHKSLIVACSALKKHYRDLLRGDEKKVFFVHLKGDFDLIFSRMQAREGHYMKVDMLRSQFATLEEPQNALTVSIQLPIKEIVEVIYQQVTSAGDND
ncbi:MAG: gluconokinase [Anaerolineales bacterium]|nr:gluconokinase [Anaerolineales bacterium]